MDSIPREMDYSAGEMEYLAGLKGDPAPRMACIRGFQPSRGSSAPFLRAFAVRLKPEGKSAVCKAP